MTKELTISFSRRCALFSRACTDKSSIESVQREKLPGVMINANLTWDDHTVGRLDYQPLFGKMSLKTRETAEIEPTLWGS